MKPLAPLQPLLRRLTRERLALAALLGVGDEERRIGVSTMLKRHDADRIGYWFPLVLSIGIATYGLVLGSTGVVIGAMLVSPLMGPIIEVGMGLVTGSPVLVLYAAVRTLASVLLVVLGSTLLTLFVPYHEVNSEILARTAPTLIDLYVASLCALAAAYTTVRQSSDTTAAAAGTAISIALVPPLCVVGWGLGSGHPEVAWGAALLFTANICAIVLFAAICFFLLGYDTVDATALELDAGAATSFLHRTSRRIRNAFGSKYGPFLRLGMPLLFVLSVYVPLRRALFEVAFKTRVRDAVERAIRELPVAAHAVQSDITVSMSGASIHLVVLGDDNIAARTKEDLSARVSAYASIAPSIEVVAVPDLAAIRGLAKSMSVPGTPPRVSAVSAARADLGPELRTWWPVAQAGELIAWSLDIPEKGAPRVRVVHFGNPLGPSGEALLMRALRGRLGVEGTIADVPLSSERVYAADDTTAWLRALTTTVDRLAIAEVGVLCLSAPAISSGQKPTPEAAAAVSGVEAQAARLAPERVARDVAEWFSFSVAPAACTTSMADAGTGDAAKN